MSGSFVEYLSRFYTGTAAHEGVFDEYNLQETGFESSLHVATTVESKVMELFQAPVPKSVILTGNAGDGKTRLARAVIEYLTGKRLESWGDGGEPFTVHLPAYTLKVVKDLSDYTREKAAQILTDAFRAFSADDSSIVYLIAANEGKLRDSLPDDPTIQDAVQKQLEGGPDLDDSRGPLVFNLNLERNSRYVTDLLKALTNEALWVGCYECSGVDRCPISFNRKRLGDPHVQGSMTKLYETIEQCGAHITMRDMLIHLTHTLIGSMTCALVLDGTEREPWKRVYYENCWAESEPQEHRRALQVVNQLLKLEIGARSKYDIDTFILHGGRTNAEHERHRTLFDDGIDLGNGLFTRLRSTYLKGYSEGAEDEPEVLKWLPHCRRKLFFEWHDPRVDELIALKMVSEFRRYVVEGEEWDLRGEALPRILMGLNRALTGYFLTGESMRRELHVTSQFQGDSQVAVPIIKLSIPASEMELQPYPSVSPDHLRLIFRKESAQYGIYLDIDQLLCEHLIRLAEGSTLNILAQECALRLHTFKEQLLGSAGTRGLRTNPNMLKFFVTADGRYREKKLMVQNGTVKLQ